MPPRRSTAVPYTKSLTEHQPVLEESRPHKTAAEVLPEGLVGRFRKHTLLSNYILESTELVSYSLLKKEKLVGTWATPLVPMQKGKLWNAKHLKPQL